MKKNLFAFLFLCCIVCSTKLRAQTKKDSLIGNYVVLHITASNALYKGDMILIVNNALAIDLGEKLGLVDNKGNYYSYEAYLFMKGVDYLDKQGFELVSSLSYNAGIGSTTNSNNHVKEYIFKRKK